MEELTHQEVAELLRSALNKNQVVVPRGSRRAPALALVKRGFLEAKPEDVVTWGESVTLKGHVLLHLSKTGRAAILALNPTDFALQKLWPLAVDIEIVQSRLRA